MENTMKSKELTMESVITPTELLEHWQGHRRLTRRVIEAFPEKELFSFSVGGMRPFSELAMEMIKMAGPGVQGVFTGKWKEFGEFDYGKGKSEPKSKAEILELWDITTKEIDKVWPQIPVQRFHEVEAAFGQYEGTMISTIFYFIDNEIHHRGQGYVYLRALNIEPPYFWER